MNIVVVGLGYVGRCLYDKISQRNYANLYALEISDNVISKYKSKYNVGSDNRKLNKADYIILCVPTPVYHNKKPDYSAINKAFLNFVKNFEILQGIN